jgi:hypothetical protein
VAIDGRLEPYRESEFPRLVESGYRLMSRAARCLGKEQDGVWRERLLHQIQHHTFVTIILISNFPNFFFLSLGRGCHTLSPMLLS